MNEGRRAFWQALSMAWELGYTISIPIVVCALAGRYLDKRFDSHPVLFLSGILLSMVVASIGVYFKAIKILREAEGEPPDKKEPGGDGPARPE